MKRIFALVLLVAICVGGSLYYYKRYKADQALTDGSFTCVGCLPPDKAAAYDRYDHGDGPDPELGRQPARSSGAQTVTSSQSASAADNPAGYAIGTTNNQVTPVVIPAGNTSLTRPVTTTTPITSPPPVIDSAPINAQNGVRYGGSGNYQWYREGNLTWRINTQTGTSCIIYATMEEWRKRVVMEHACGRDA